MSNNAAIQVLEAKIHDLTEGMDSIPYLKDEIERCEGRLKDLRKTAKYRKKVLLECRQALELLKAGEEE